MAELHFFQVYFLNFNLILTIIYIYFIASPKGQIEVIKVLLNHNADIEAKEMCGKNSLSLGIFLNY
jgi:hypothetical protein